MSFLPPVLWRAHKDFAGESPRARLSRLAVARFVHALEWLQMADSNAQEAAETIRRDVDIAMTEPGESESVYWMRAAARKCREAAQAFDAAADAQDDLRFEGEFARLDVQLEKRKASAA
jgi:hypothetical protein